MSRLQVYENSTHICTLRSEVFSGNDCFVTGDANVFVTSCELYSIQKGFIFTDCWTDTITGIKKGIWILQLILYLFEPNGGFQQCFTSGTFPAGRTHPTLLSAVNLGDSIAPRRVWTLAHHAEGQDVNLPVRPPVLTGVLPWKLRIQCIYQYIQSPTG